MLAFYLNIAESFSFFHLILQHLNPRNLALLAHLKTNFDHATSTHIVPPPPVSAGGRGANPATKFTKRGGLVGSQFLEGIAGKRGEDDLFQKGLQFVHKK